MKKKLLVILSAVCVLGVTGKLGRKIIADKYGTLSKEQIIIMNVLLQMTRKQN